MAQFVELSGAQVLGLLSAGPLVEICDASGTCPVVRSFDTETRSPSRTAADARPSARGRGEGGPS